jgi:proline racemase
MFEKMTYLATERDQIRLRMLREPRGYPAANCNLILPPTNPEADAGFVIMEQTEYPPMSGTNTICVVTVLIETGMVPAVEPITRLKLDTPAGLVAVEAEVVNGKVRRVTFRNVPPSLRTSMRLSKSPASAPSPSTSLMAACSM